MACQRCVKDPTPNNLGDPRRCAFNASGEFVEDNWNCATIEELLRSENIEERQCGSVTMHFLPDIVDDDGGTEREGWIVLTRYKQRGKTSSAIRIGDGPAFALHLNHASYVLSVPGY